MTDHRAEAERHLSKGSYTDHRGIPSEPRATDFHLRMALVHATLADRQDPIRALLDTLANRWLEVADSNKPADGDRGDLADKSAAYRLIYLRNIRDLRHVLDTGRIPCSLMTADERANGGCGHQHIDEEDES